REKRAPWRVHLHVVQRRGRRVGDRAAPALSAGAGARPLARFGVAVERRQSGRRPARSSERATDGRLERGMLALPTGTVTFLFTDVEGSTRLWTEQPEAMRDALARHDGLLEALTERHHGQVVRPRGEGDSRFCVFARASDAVAAAAAMQVALHRERWSTRTPLWVRIALHTGEADVRDGDYYGSE